jgi:hypothetical protein
MKNMKFFAAKGSTVMVLGCALIFSSLTASRTVMAKETKCPAEVQSGSEFPKEENGVTWHDSNSVNFNIDYKAVCSWKKVTPSKRKEGHVCTYSEFSECSVEGTPAGTKFYLTDYKPVIKAPAKK